MGVCVPLSAIWADPALQSRPAQSVQPTDNEREITETKRLGAKAKSEKRIALHSANAKVLEQEQVKFFGL